MDYRIPLACVLIAGGAVGLAVPMFALEDGLASTTVEPSPTASPDAMLAALGDGQVRWNEEFTLQRQVDGHFYAEVSIDGVPSRMLVDTGASIVALTGEDASAAGIYWDDHAIAPVAQGASGPVFGVPVMLPRVSLGAFEATDVDAIVVPDGLAISLLGQSFLSTVDRVEIADDRMILGQ
ncbi:retropepsin-like aspartic protease family protein [Aurantiacibacter spongiae]|uniref:TIGR02281 family clan AA aspartic protease n=1 Tax=Aurantiacibacter spongiae TaxID=2488860 RepID=A0A3N5DRP3_9SPHN|nr:TIGR02281 family clan AA aspartic protease [Aurantiacibacter spongiae]RPF71861.1 TIGR02281 family clan AA aspartic protease [Aurantiacibacter spongiae]